MSRATARLESGTRYSFFAFMRSAGTIHRRASRSISAQVAPRVRRSGKLLDIPIRPKYCPIDGWITMTAPQPPVRRIVMACWLACLALLPRWAAAEALSFGVLPQRSPVLTAEYWNPILDYVSRHAGVRLHLRVTRTPPETNRAIARGEYDFVYANTIFTPRNAVQDYRVILKPRSAPIRAQIVTLADSPIRSVAQLQGRAVGFPTRAAVTGYALPMDHLLRQGVQVTPVFGGTQEGIMAQLKSGRVVAAGVNSQVMQAFAAREGVSYRVLWQSPPCLGLPIAAHPRVPAATVEAVRRAFARMPHDPEGQRVLAASAAVIRQPPPFGFEAANPQDYQDYVDFYRTTVVKDIE